MMSNYDFEIVNGVLVKYKGKGGDVIIPDGVTNIGDWAFHGCRSLTSVTIPESVTSIGRSAFDGCSSLTSITIPESVTGIGESAFEKCSSLTSITIPESVTSIGYGAFEDCSSLTSITIPKSVTSIDESAFRCCSSLTSITIPGSVTSIGKSAFRDCSSLTGISIPNSVMSIGEEVFCGCSSLTSITIPDSVTSIGKYAFFGCSSLTSITIPKGVTSIGAGAFCKCNAMADINGFVIIKCVLYSYAGNDKNVTISDNVTSISNFAFSNCNGLTSITIPNSVTDIGDYAFSACSSLTSITIPDSVTDIARNAFYGCEKISQVTATYKAMLNCKPVWEQILEPYLCDDINGDEGIAEDRVRIIKKTPKGKRTEFAWYLLPSKSKAVARLFEELGRLDEYAAVLATDEDTLRDTLLSDFGLNLNGQRSWPLAGSVITAQLNADLTLTLTDATGKVLKSVPKKGAEEAEYNAVKTEFAKLKKDIVTAAKLRNNRLLMEFLSGKTRGAENWKSAYLGNPLLRLLARLLIWQQGESTFTLREDGTACDVNNKDYIISDKPIGLAHPMEMTKKLTEAWQKYFLDRSLKQPFEQVWEPVADAAYVKPGHYDGCTVPLYALMNKEKHGIIMEGQSRITLKDCSAGLKLVEGHHDWVNNEFEITDFKYEKFTRQVNHIVVHLDKVTVVGRIKKDDVSVAQWLQPFTAAQINEFIDIATKSEATNCTALLLDYKSKTYPEVDPFAEFTLDLL